MANDARHGPADSQFVDVYVHDPAANLVRDPAIAP
jgi:hypothetical protein